MARGSFVPSRGRVARLPAVAVIASLVVATPREAHGQANIPVFRGDVGLQAGTQAAPGAYAGIMYNNYRSNRVEDGIGSSIDLSTNFDVLALTAEYSSPWKLRGARWSALAILPFMNADLNVVNFAHGTSWGLADLYVVPLQLGWTFKRADLLFGQGFFAPTGRFEVNSTSNTGFGMWSWESTLGATGYFDKTRTTNISTLASFQVQSHARGSDRRAGNVLTLEGGLGQTVAAIKGRLGAVYYAQWKTSADQNYPLTFPFDRRSRYIGLGVEATAGVVTKSVTAVFTLRYYNELWNRVAPEGNSLFLIATLHASPKAKAKRR